MINEEQVGMYRDTPPTWWSLDSDRINGLQQESILSLVNRCKAAHFVDVHVRINGQWEVYQADWIKHLMPRPRPTLTTWRLFTFALGHQLARFRAMLPWRRRSLDASGAGDCAFQQMAPSTRPDQGEPSKAVGT